MFSRLSIWFYDVPSICYTWNSSICWFVALLTGCPFLVMIGSEVSPWKIPTNSGDLPNLQALQTIPSWCLSVSWKKVKHQLLLNGKMMVFVHGEKWGFMNFNCGSEHLLKCFFWVMIWNSLEPLITVSLRLCDWKRIDRLGSPKFPAQFAALLLGCASEFLCVHCLSSCNQL